MGECTLEDRKVKEKEPTEKQQYDTEGHIMQERQSGSGIFREKSISRVSSPEELNDYIRVTTPSVWIVLIALVALLVGMLAWSIFGTVEKHGEAGSLEEVHPITYVTN